MMHGKMSITNMESQMLPGSQQKIHRTPKRNVGGTVKNLLAMDQAGNLLS